MPRLTAPLTARQQQLFDFILREHRAGRAPSLREMAAAIGVASVNGVQGHVAALLKKGAVVRGGTGQARQVRPAPEDPEFRQRPRWSLPLLGRIVDGKLVLCRENENARPQGQLRPGERGAG